MHSWTNDVVIRCHINIYLSLDNSDDKMLTVIILHIMFNMEMDEVEYDLRSEKQKEQAEK